MLQDILAKSVLSIGCEYKYPKGGVAQVIYNYENYIFPCFQCITNSGDCSKWRNIVKGVYALWQMYYKLLVDKDIKIVHIHTASYNSFKRSAWFVLLAKKFKKKIILHIHGGGFKEYYITKPQWISSVLNQCDAIITLSNSWKQYFESITNAPVIYIVENIVPFPNSQSEKKVRYDGKYHLLFLGTITREKGIFDLIDVLHENANLFADKLILHIGGNGKTEQLNKMIQEYRLENCVQYEGFVTLHKKESLLNELDAFILPSYVEGLPVSILEAMSYKMPILTTPVGGIPDVVKQNVNGILFQPGDKNGISKAIERVVNNHTENKLMGERSFQMVQPFFPTNVESRLKNIYKKLLSLK